jgi:hypothetical protein
MADGWVILHVGVDTDRGGSLGRLHELEARVLELNGSTGATLDRHTIEQPGGYLKLRCPIGLHHGFQLACRERGFSAFEIAPDPE